MTSDKLDSTLSNFRKRSCSRDGASTHPVRLSNKKTTAMQNPRVDCQVVVAPHYNLTYVAWAQHPLIVFCTLEV